MTRELRLGLRCAGTLGTAEATRGPLARWSVLPRLEGVLQFGRHTARVTDLPGSLEDVRAAHLTALRARLSAAELGPRRRLGEPVTGEADVRPISADGVAETELLLLFPDLLATLLGGLQPPVAVLVLPSGQLAVGCGGGPPGFTGLDWSGTPAYRRELTAWVWNGRGWRTAPEWVARHVERHGHAEARARHEWRLMGGDVPALAPRVTDGVRIAAVNYVATGRGYCIEFAPEPWVIAYGLPAPVDEAGAPVDVLDERAMPPRQAGMLRLAIDRLLEARPRGADMIDGTLWTIERHRGETRERFQSSGGGSRLWAAFEEELAAILRWEPADLSRRLPARSSGD